MPVAGEFGLHGEMDRAIDGTTTTHVFPGSDGGGGTIPTLVSTNLILICIGWNSSSRSLSSISDSAGNTWVEVIETDSFTNNGRIAWYRLATWVGQPTAINVTFSGANNSASFALVIQYSDADHTTIQTAQSTQDAFVGTDLVGPLTPTASGAMAVDGCSITGATTWARDNNYTIIEDDRRLIVQHRTVAKPDATAESIGITISNNARNLNRAMLLFESGGAPQPQPPVQDGGDIPDIEANEGESGSYDVAANNHFSLGANGVGPLTYSKDETSGPLWPSDIDINTAGLISWTTAVVPGQADLQVLCTDSGAALSTSSNLIDYTVTGPAPPDPLSSYPDIAIAPGASYSDATVRWQVDPTGGTGPISYSESPAGTAWPADISINASTGEITVASGVQGATNGLQVRATDDGNGLFSDGNAFNYAVTTAPGVITTAPAQDAQNPPQPVTGLTNCVVVVVDAVTGAFLHHEIGIDQNPDGTFTLSTTNITPGGNVMGFWAKYDGDASNRYWGAFDLPVTL